MDTGNRRYEGLDFLRSVIDSSMDGFLLLDAKGNILHANDSYCQMIGYALDEIVNMHICEIDLVYSPEALARFADTIIDAGAMRFQTRQRHKNGAAIDIEVSANHSTLYGGVFCSFIRDISGRKSAEETLQESQQRLNHYIDHSPLGAIEWDADFVVTRWSGEAERMFGWSQAETVGKPIMDLQLIYEEDIPAVQRTLKKLADGTSNYVVFTNRNYTKDRTVITCEWYSTVLTNAQGQMVSVFSQVLDVSERKRLEAVLRSSYAYTRSLIEASLDPLLTISPDGKITDVNEASAKVTGVPREQLIGKDFTAYFTDPEKARETYLKVFSVGSVRDYPLAIRHSSGDVTEVLYNATVFKNEKGEVRGVFAAARDVTELNRATGRLRKAHAELEMRVAERTEELALANEQREKISFQLVWAEERERERIAAELHDRVGQSLLLAKLKLDAVVDSGPPDPARGNAVSAATLLEESIEDIRSLTFRMRPPILDTAGIDTTLKWLCSSISKDYNVEIHFDGDGHSTTIPKAMRYSLYHAVRELLLNVAKHARTGKALLQVCSVENSFLVKVVDDGVGFNYPEDSLKMMSKGSYGLYNVRQRIEQLGGEFVIDSAPGRGTAVTLKVPLVGMP